MQIISERREGLRHAWAAVALICFAPFSNASLIQDVVLTSFEGGPGFNLGRLEFPVGSQSSELFPTPTCNTANGPSDSPPGCEDVAFTTSDAAFFNDIGGSGVDLRNTTSTNNTGGWFISPVTGALDFFLQGFVFDLGAPVGPTGDQFQYVNVVFDTVDFFESGPGGPGFNGAFDTGNVCIRGSLNEPTGNCFAEDTLVELATFVPVRDDQGQQVPAPATLALVGLGLVGLRLRRKA